MKHLAFILACVLMLALAGPGRAAELDRYVDLDNACVPDGLANSLKAYLNPAGFWQKQFGKMEAAIRFNENWIKEAEQTLAAAPAPDAAPRPGVRDDNLTPGQRKSFRKISQGAIRKMLRENLIKREKLEKCRKTVKVKVEAR